MKVSSRLLFRAILQLSCCLVGVGMAGCVSESRGKAPPALLDFSEATVEELNLLAIPVALNLDDKPGVDGFVIKVYASNRKRPKPLSLTKGTLEIFMYDGVPGVTGDITAEPTRTWKYPAAELTQFEIHTSIGTGYQFALAWGEAAPKRNRISVICRYSLPRHTPIRSAPSIISVALK